MSKSGNSQFELHLFFFSIFQKLDRHSYHLFWWHGHTGVKVCSSRAPLYYCTVASVTTLLYKIEVRKRTHGARRSVKGLKLLILWIIDVLFHHVGAGMSEHSLCLCMWEKRGGRVRLDNTRSSFSQQFSQIVYQWRFQLWRFEFFTYHVMLNYHS